MSTQSTKDSEGTPDTETPQDPEAPQDSEEAPGEGHHYMHTFGGEGGRWFSYLLVYLQMRYADKR